MSDDGVDQEVMEENTCGDLVVDCVGVPQSSIDNDDSMEIT